MRLRTLRIVAILLVSLGLVGCSAQRQNLSESPQPQGEFFGGLVTKPNTFSPSTIIRSSDVNANFDTLFSLVNGNIDNSNLAAGANIAASKIAGTAIVSVPSSTQTITLTSSTQLIVKGAVGQTADPFDIQNSAGNSLFSILSNGATNVSSGTLYIASSTHKIWRDGNDLVFTDPASGANWTLTQLVNSSGLGSGYGVNIINNIVYANVSTTLGMATSTTDGSTYLKVKTNEGWGVDNNGGFVDKTQNFTWSGAHTFTVATTTFSVPLVATVTSSLATTTISDIILSTEREGYLNKQTFTAGQEINTSVSPRAVYLSSFDGKVYQTAATSTSEATFGFIGFAIKGQSVVTSSQIIVQTSGVVSGFNGLVPGNIYFVSNTLGLIDTVTGTYAYRIGRGVSSTTFIIDKGAKTISGINLFSSSGSTVITLGFRPVRIRIHGTAGGSVSDGGWTENGGNKNINVSAAGGSSSDGTLAWSLIENTNTNLGSVSAVTSTGFTLTNTRTNSPNTAIIYWEAEG